MGENLRTDVLIVGGGLVGSTLASALAEGGLTSIVIDRSSPRNQNTRSFDGRATAVAQSTKRMLTVIGIWSNLKGKVSPIYDIRVTDGNSRHYLHFDHSNMTEDALGYMIENHFLRRAILRTTLKREEIKYMAPVELTEVVRNSKGICAVLADGREIHAALIVGADGRSSYVRQHAGIPVTKWSYKQAGIVCTVAHDKPQYNIAHDHFFPAGPFAILPLVGDRSSIVWTENLDDARMLIELPGREFLLELAQRFGDFLGPLEVVGPRSSYPLHLQFAESCTAPRLALVGDAIHGMHPVAGQGFNMGLRDVAALTEVLVDAYRLGLDIGTTNSLRQFERWRRFDNTLMLAATDGLNRLFSNDSLPFQLVRDLGLAVVNASSTLKNVFMRQAMGLTGNLPRLMRGDDL